MKSFIPVLAAFCLISIPVFANDSSDDSRFNRPRVIQASTRLASEVEHFDEALHDVNAPAHVIKLVHHFEETVTEFAMMAKTASYQELYSEFDHIREDMKMIREEMAQHPKLMQNQNVFQEYQHMRTAYRALDHAMFFRFTNRWTTEAVEQLNSDLADMEASH